MKSILIFTTFLTSICLACVESVDFDWPDQKPKLVVDGIITNEPDGNFVRLTWSDSIVVYHDSPFGSPNDAAPVNDALIIVSDDMGNSDTLSRRYDYKYIWDNVSGSNIRDSFLNEKGYYDIENIHGLPGHEYYMTIKYNNHEYYASAYMNAVPEIDSIYFKETYNAVKHEYYYPVLISFPTIENSGNNYMFIYQGGNYEYLQRLEFNMTLLSGEYLTSYVYGLDVCQGYSGAYWLNGYASLTPGDSVGIAMYAITSEGYKFYDALVRQIENYDGVFNPAPTTPVGNISGGAFGYFGASAVSRISGFVPE